MGLAVHVESYAGYRSHERPLRFHLDEARYDIAAIEDRWYEPDAEYFKVRTTDGKHYMLRYSEHDDTWTLQSTLDGEALMARPGS